MPFKPFTDYLLLEKKYSQHTAVAYQSDIEMFQLFLTNEFSGSEVSDANYSQIRSWIVELVSANVTNKTINR